MNLIEVWIKDIVEIKEVEFNGVTKLKITFNTVCYGHESTDYKLFDNMEEWEKFKEKGYYLA